MEDSVTFESCYVELLQTNAKSGGYKRAQEIIAQLNLMNYRIKIPFLNKWTCTDMIVHLLNMMKEFQTDKFDICPALQFIANIADKQEIIVCSLSVNVILHGLMDMWRDVYAQGDSNTICLLLGAISAVVYGNGAYIIPETIKWLLDLESDLNIVASAPVEMRRVYVHCLSGMCLSSDSREQLPEEFAFSCLRIFVTVLQAVNVIVEVTQFKLVYAAHRGIQHAIEHSNGVHVEIIGPLLAVIRKHMMFGLPLRATELPSVLHPVPIPESFNLQPNLSNRSVKKKKKNRSKHSNKTSQGNKVTNAASSDPNPKSLKQQAPIQTLIPSGPAASVAPSTSGFPMFPTSSESELSDSEANQSSRLHSFALKIRQISFGNLYLVINKTSRHVMYGYWSAFIDDPSRSNLSLLSCITRDPAPKARVAALSVLCALLEGSKGFLLLVCQETTSTSFVTFSGLVTSLIHIIHDNLIGALPKERSAVVQVHILKTLAVVAANTPYSKLHKYLISAMCSVTQRFLKSTQDTDIQIAASNIFIALCGHDPAFAEIAWAITDCKNTGSSSNLTTPLSTVKIENITKSELLEHFIGLLDFSKDFPLSLRVSSLQALTALCKPYFVVARIYIKDLKQVFKNSISYENTSVNFHSLKLLEVLGSSLLKQADGTTENIEFWQDILSKAIQTVTQNNREPSIISQICDCLATVGPNVFAKLPRGLQLFCQTFLLGCTGDDSYLVRSASVRSLAVFIMYPELRKDIAFIEDVARCIVGLMKDSVKSVQCNAAWSFGNLTDAIIISTRDKELKEQFRLKLIEQLFETAIASYDNKDKVRFNIMRALGNLLRFCDKSHASSDRLKALMLKAIDAIISGLRKDPLMKVRWNACLACGNFLNNESLPVGESEWSDEMYDALGSAVATSKNYKVRIKAAAALSCPRARSCYGDKLSSLCKCITASWQKLKDEAIEFGEFRFRERLHEQLCCTFVHFISVMKSEDFSDMAAFIDSNFFREELDNCYSSFLHQQEEKKKNNAVDESNGTQGEFYVPLGELRNCEKVDLFRLAAHNWQAILKLQPENLQTTETLKLFPGGCLPSN